MIQYFKDAALTRPVTGASPVWVFSPPGGVRRRLSLWLADTYGTPLATAAAPGDTSLDILQSTAFPSSGSVVVGGRRIDYSSIVEGELQTAPLAVAVPAGTLVYPCLVYSGSTNLTIWPAGAVQVALKTSAQSQYGIPGTPLLYDFQSAPSTDSNGPVALARIDLEVTLPAGEDIELSDLKLIPSALRSAAGVSETPQAFFHIVRRSQALRQRLRIYPESRRVDDAIPGFVYGSYRWRDQDQVNAHAIVPPQWDLDVDTIGREKFVSGIGEEKALAVSGTDTVVHSVFPRLESGFYWIGPDRHYMPSDSSVSLVVPVSERGLTIPLEKKPRIQSPFLIGNYQTDTGGYYRPATRYDYMPSGLQPDGPEYQFTVDRRNNTLSLNRGLTFGRLFLGVAPQALQAVFDLPVFPVGQVSRVVLGASGTAAEQPVTRFEFNAGSGEVSVWFDDTMAGRDIYVDCTPAVKIDYETDGSGMLSVPVDLNPAFAGIARGTLYLEHRRRRVSAISLFCDKPRIITPRGYDMVSDLVSFGPVFYEHDFALLQAVVSGDRSGETVPGARLELVTDDSFEGAINYQDPAQVPVLTTGSDGVVSFVYTPPDAFGQYLALSSVAGAAVTLPAPISIQQLWNTDEGWKARIYMVSDDDAFFGKVAARPDYGEVAWQVWGVPGTVSYQTNGRRDLIQFTGQPAVPADAFDIVGKSYLDPAFNGNVVSLSFAQALPRTSVVGAYFLTYVGRVLLQVRDRDTGVLSNTILLDLQTPPPVVDESGVAGYLILDSGRLNINRLGGAPVLPIAINTSRY